MKPPASVASPLAVGQQRGIAADQREARLAQPFGHKAGTDGEGQLGRRSAIANYCQTELTA